MISCPLARPENLIRDRGRQCIESGGWYDVVAARIAETGPLEERFFENLLDVFDGFEMIQFRIQRRGDEEAKSNGLGRDCCFRGNGMFENGEWSAKGDMTK